MQRKRSGRLMFLRSASNGIRSVAIMLSSCYRYANKALILVATRTRSCPSTTPPAGRSRVFRPKRLKRWVNLCFILVFPSSRDFLKHPFFSLFHDTKTLDPKWNEEFFFRVSKPPTASGCHVHTSACMLLIWVLLNLQLHLESRVVA